MSFPELAKDGYSTRKFSDRPAEQSKLDLILEAGRIASTAHNSQPQRILVLNTPEEMELLTECCLSRFHQTLALVVHYKKEVSWKRKDYNNADSGEVDMGIVGAYIILRASELGTGSTWVIHFDPQVTCREFHIPEALVSTAILMMGYPREDTEPSRLYNDRFGLSKTMSYRTFQG